MTGIYTGFSLGGGGGRGEREIRERFVENGEVMIMKAWTNHYKFSYNFS